MKSILKTNHTNIKEVVWKWDWGVYMVFCPYCDEPAYEKEGCVFCKKPYKWVEGEIKDTVLTKGDYTVVQCTNNHIQLYKNGELIMHSSCTKKMSEEELLKQIDLYENFTESGNFEKIYEDESEEGPHD